MILSVDAVQFDDVSPRLYVIRELLSEEILAAERIEKADTKRLAAFLERVKAIGVPVDGIVTDKEKALIAAVELIFPGIPHQYCQTHFLGHLGEGIQGLTEPAQKRRGFRRNRKGQLKAAFEAFSPKKRGAPKT